MNNLLSVATTTTYGSDVHGNAASACEMRHRLIVDQREGHSGWKSRLSNGCATERTRHIETTDAAELREYGLPAGRPQAASSK